MTWPKSEQVKAERRWFMETADQVAEVCGGSLISGRRTKTRNADVGGHVESLHMMGLGADYEFDTESGYLKAWELGRSLGLHGYKKRQTLGIHWQSRPRRRRT